MSNEKTEKLSSKLMMKREHFSVSHAGEVEAADAYCEGYKAFLNAAKTERECADWFSKKAEEAGIRDKVKIMVGGAPVDQAFCDKIGADAYTPDAASAADKAVELCRELAGDVA